LQFGTLSNSEEVSRLQLELRPLMLRRVKEDVEKSIPAKQETVIDVELTNLQVLHEL
jgi:SNF2 family DNA or RNA helicase